VALVDGRLRSVDCVCCSCGFPSGCPTTVTEVGRFRFSSLPTVNPCRRVLPHTATSLVRGVAARAPRPQDPLCTAVRPRRKPRCRAPVRGWPDTLARIHPPDPQPYEPYHTA